MSKRRMSMREALEIIPDNMGEMAQIAMAAEIAGIDFSDAFLELEPHARGPMAPPAPKARKVAVADAARKQLMQAGCQIEEFVLTHWRINQAIDFWPTTGRWKRLDRKAQGRDLQSLLKHIWGRK